MNELIPAVTDLMAEIDDMDPEQRRRDAENCSVTIAVATLRLSAHVASAERRGEPLDDWVHRYGPRFVDRLRRVACGMILPEVLCRFDGTAVMDVVARLPLPDQRRLGDGEKIPVLMVGPDGRYEQRMEDPLVLGREQVLQVFDRGRIRAPEEQAAHLDRERAREAAKVREQFGLLRIDRERGGVTVGRRFVPLCDLVAAVKALRG